VKKSEGFEESIKKLDEIVKKMEKGDAPLQEMLKMFEEGIELTRHCQNILDNAEKKVSILLKNDAGDFIEKDFQINQE
jgi:exodeoxyribonuclease VII small subunit